jgi:prevent-host-death family protein
MKKKIGLREANQYFSKAIQAVRAGKEVVLTDRGQTIAVITPIKAEPATNVALAQMASEGLITLPSRKGPLPRFAPARITGTPVSQTIIDDRNDRV